MKPPQRQNSSKRGYDYEWKQRKDRFLARQRPVARCVCCEAQGVWTIVRGRTGLLVDHIVPVELLPPEEFFDETNWQVLCLDCDLRFKKPLEKRCKHRELLVEEWADLLRQLRLGTYQEFHPS